jgi:hypothetical protein
MDDGKGQPWPNHVGVGIVFGPKNSNGANYQGSDCKTGVCAHVSLEFGKTTSHAFQ